MKGQWRVHTLIAKVILLEYLICNLKSFFSVEEAKFPTFQAITLFSFLSLYCYETYRHYYFY